jgi:hypothetical protein
MTTSFDPALLTAFRGTKGHSHQISDRHRVFAKIEKSRFGALFMRFLPLTASGPSTASNRRLLNRASCLCYSSQYD